MNGEKQEMDNGLELLNKVIKSNEDNKIGRAHV